MKLPVSTVLLVGLLTQSLVACGPNLIRADVEPESPVVSGGAEDPSKPSSPSEPVAPAPAPSVRTTFGANANVRAFLDVIGFAEGAGDSYNIMFSGATFSNFKDHPRSVRCSYGYCSDAAGRYQFLSTTWDSVKRGAGVSDFSPESQDKGCIYLLKSIGVYETVHAISSRNDFESAIYDAGGTWASFPGSPYGQSAHSMGTLWTKFQEFKNRY